MVGTISSTGHDVGALAALPQLTHAPTSRAAILAVFATPRLAAGERLRLCF